MSAPNRAAYPAATFLGIGTIRQHMVSVVDRGRVHAPCSCRYSSYLSSEASASASRLLDAGARLVFTICHGTRRCLAPS